MCSKQKNFSLLWKRARIFLLSKTKNCQKHFSMDDHFPIVRTVKKFISRLHCQIKIPFLLHMIASTFPHHPPRNKNFSMHTPWVKNFLLSQNTKNGSKKFLSRLHSKLKFFCLLHMMLHALLQHPWKIHNFIWHTPPTINFFLFQTVTPVFQ